MTHSQDTPCARVPNKRYCAIYWNESRSSTVSNRRRFKLCPPARLLGNSGWGHVRQRLRLAEFRDYLYGVREVLEVLKIHPLLASVVRLGFADLLQITDAVVLCKQLVVRHRCCGLACEHPLFTRFLADSDSGAISERRVVARVNGHLVHQFPHRRIHIFFFCERVEIDLFIQDHPRNDERQTVVSSFLVSRVPLLRIRVFLPQNKVEFHFDRGDLLRAGPGDQIRCDVLAENLRASDQGIALVAAPFSVRSLDGGSTISTRRET